MPRAPAKGTGSAPGVKPLGDFAVTPESAAHASIDAWLSRRYDWLNPQLHLVARDERDTMMPEMVGRLRAVLDRGYPLFAGEVWMAGNLQQAGFIVTNYRAMLHTISGRTVSLGYPDLSLYTDQKAGFLSFRLRGKTMAIPMTDLLHGYYPLPAPLLKIHGAREWAQHLPESFWPAISMSAQEAEKRFGVTLPIEQLANVATWMIAVDGQQYGPYDARTLKGMIRAKQIDPLVCLVWSEGMDYWAPMNQEARLQAALGAKPAAAPAGAPPSPPPASVVASAPGSPSGEEQTGLVDVNNAGLDELLTLDPMTLEGAETILAQRASRLGFRRLEDVGEALRLQPHQVERLRGQVRFGEYRGGGPVTSARGRVIDY